MREFYEKVLADRIRTLLPIGARIHVEGFPLSGSIVNPSFTKSWNMNSTMWSPIATTIRDSRHHHVPHLIQSVGVAIVRIVHHLIIHLVVVNPPWDGGGMRDLVNAGKGWRRGTGLPGGICPGGCDET